MVLLQTYRIRIPTVKFPLCQKKKKEGGWAREVEGEEEPTQVKQTSKNAPTVGFTGNCCPADRTGKGNSFLTPAMITVDYLPRPTLSRHYSSTVLFLLHA